MFLKLNINILRYWFVSRKHQLPNVSIDDFTMEFIELRENLFLLKQWFYNSQSKWIIYIQLIYSRFPTQIDCPRIFINLKYYDYGSICKTFNNHDLLNAYFRNYKSADHKKVFIYSLIAIVSSTVFMLVKKSWINIA